MVFVCFVGLIALLICAIWANFSTFGLREKLIKMFFSIFDFLLPDADADADDSLVDMKEKMAGVAAYILAFVVFIFLTSVFFSFALPYAFEEDENKYFGPLGDLFNGILTPFLTFLTFCGLLITIMIQNRQMKETLNELALTRNEAAASKVALEQQVENAQLQKFDNNFFNLLNHQEKIIQKIIDEGIINDEIREVNGYFDASVDIFYKIKRKEKFTSFFLVNYQILKFIKKNSCGNVKILNEDGVKYYSNILRSVIPQGLLLLLFINCHNEDFPEYKKMLTDNEFFEHLQFEGITNNSIYFFINKYNKKAFGDNKNVEILLENLIKSTINVKNNFFYSRLFDLHRMNRSLLESKLSGNEAENYSDVALNMLRKFNRDIGYARIINSLNDQNFLEKFYEVDQHYIYHELLDLDAEAQEVIAKVWSAVNE